MDSWPNKVKVMQKNWIGKSFGCEIDFKIEGELPVEKIKCFTTRPDTLFGFSFLALSIDHEISNFYNDDYDVIVSVDSQTWKGIILRTESAARAIASGKLSIDGESLKFLQFSSLFVND